MQTPSQSLTIKANGQLNVIKTECHVTQIVSPGTPPALDHKFQAIWDTGATMSCITQNVVDKCKLQPTGMVQVHGVSGANTVETYLVAIFLPNHVCFSPVRVTKGNLGSSADLLIGMDIIAAGDFAITNAGAKTVFSFRFPSQSHIDYVQEHNDSLVKKAFFPTPQQGKPWKGSGKSKGKGKK
ncbi:retropepsin-like aspartic protease [Paraburkholderia sediminicola]|uniref:retropepsin-like aspartic protease n=1 Tax=Paraburkholderia sediminicola TaxID=458836 RepID=UPI0038B6EE6D